MPQERLEQLQRSGRDRRAIKAWAPPGGDDRLTSEILANMFAGVALIRASDATFLYVNPLYESMFGYESGELENQPVSVINAPGNRTPEAVAEGIIETLRTEGKWAGEIENIKKDGTHLFCLAHVTTFNHAIFGEVWIVVQLDISAKKKAELELSKSEERLELVLQATSGGAWDWDIPSGEVHFSSYWIKSLGYSPEEVPGNATFWEKLIHPDDLPRVQQALADHFEGRSSAYECVNRLRKKDGTWRWNLDRGQVVQRSESGIPLRMVGTDTDLSMQRWSGLKEFIPICAGCKKIRGDDGQWLSLEAHFHQRSLAQFSHGICPECVQKFYADVPVALR